MPGSFLASEMTQEPKRESRMPYVLQWAGVTAWTRAQFVVAVRRAVACCNLDKGAGNCKGEQGCASNATLISQWVYSCLVVLRTESQMTYAAIAVATGLGVLVALTDVTCAADNQPQQPKSCGAIYKSCNCSQFRADPAKMAQCWRNCDKIVDVCDKATGRKLR